MSPKPGTKVALVPPVKPVAAQEAITAKPGEGTVASTEPVSVQSESMALVKTTPHKPPSSQTEKEQKPSWIEIEMIDEEGNLLPGVRYRVLLPDGTVDEGTLDAKGFARIEGFAPGECKVEFPDFDGREWKPA